MSWFASLDLQTDMPMMVRLECSSVFVSICNTTASRLWISPSVPASPAQNTGTLRHLCANKDE